MTKIIQVCTILILILYCSSINAQLTKLNVGPIHSESDVYLDVAGNRHSDMITAKFNTRIIDLDIGKKKIKIDKLNNSSIRTIMKDIKKIMENLS